MESTFVDRSLAKI